MSASAQVPGSGRGDAEGEKSSSSAAAGNIFIAVISVSKAAIF